MSLSSTDNQQSQPKKSWLKANALAIITALLGAGLLGEMAGIWKFNQEFSERETQVLFQELKNELEFYKEENRSCRDEVDEVKKELYQLKSSLQLVGALSSDIPLAMWLKDRDGKMLYISPRYEQVFLRPRGYKIADYHTDYDVWPKDVADAYRANDLLAMKSKEPIITIEMVPNPMGQNEKWVVIKFRREIGQTLVGIGGICFEHWKIGK